MLGLLVISGYGSEAPGRELSTERFANVFTECQPVHVAIAAGDALTVQLRDIDGAEVARRDAPVAAGELDFGTLPPGYYEAVAGDATLPLVVLLDPDKRVKGDSRLSTDNAMSSHRCKGMRVGTSVSFRARGSRLHIR